MPSNTFHFVSRWRVRAALEEVADIIEDFESLPRWWPAVYLEVHRLEPGGSDGVGTAIALHTKGWLPYTLWWRLRVIRARYPHGFTIAAEGDFVGEGEWTFTQDGDCVDVEYDWQIRAEKPLLRRASFLLKPLFERNHAWAMAMGERSLRLELLRRRVRGATPAIEVRPPPGLTSTRTFVAGALLVVSALIGVWWVARRPRL